MAVAVTLKIGEGEREIEATYIFTNRASCASHNPKADDIGFAMTRNTGHIGASTEIASIGGLYKYARNDEERTAADVEERTRRPKSTSVTQKNGLYLAATNDRHSI